jgi:hypothetical protein
MIVVLNNPSKSTDKVSLTICQRRYIPQIGLLALSHYYDILNKNL